ncbi:MAG: hypothetical protein HY893_07480 [Deltaproteobacteria bacterium]|nr:hypothetical protein [Deltaproteobacteria bacterium]
MQTPSIKKGRIIIYRLFDVALEINLASIERTAREGARRLKFSKYPYMKALEFTNPPLSFELAPFNKFLFGQETKVNVIAKAYDFGVLSVAFDAPIPEGCAFALLEEVTKGLDIDSTVDEKAREYAKELMESLGSALVNPELKEGFTEDYMIIYIEELEGGAQPGALLEAYDPSRLLLYEDRELSRFTRQETLRHSFSYYPEDLIIVHVDNALIIDPSGSFDMPDILEFANAQIFELRYYDNIIDKELKSIYGELSGRRRGVSIFRLREYERLAKKITQTITDITEVTERVNNSLKVTEDIYYARIYRTFMALLRSRDLEVGIREKLQIVMDTYKMLHDEIAAKRGYLLELGIFILIALEFALVIIGR